jgi:hypothetical protein
MDRAYSYRLGPSMWLRGPRWRERPRAAVWGRDNWQEESACDLLWRWISEISLGRILFDAFSATSVVGTD